MSEVSQERIDVKKIKIVPDGASFTGYSIVAMDKDGGGHPGLPASVFEVALYREMKRLERENIKLRTFVNNIHGPANDEQWDLEQMMKDSWAQTLSDLDVAVEEGEDVAVAS